MNTIYKVMSTTVMIGSILGVTVCGGAHAAPVNAIQSVSASVQPKHNTIQSETHQNISLGISGVIYDGNALRFEVVRKGTGLSGRITDSKWDEQKQEVIREKGAISSVELFINGVSANTYGGSELWKRPAISFRTADSSPDKALFSMADATYLGEQASLKALPEQFNLTAKIKLEGVNDPYTLNVPVQKNAGKTIQLKPNLTKKSGDVAMTLKKASMTSYSTRMQLIVKGQKPGSAMLYDFLDDQGNLIERLGGERGTDENGAKGMMYYDFLLDTQGKDIKSITIKPSKPVFAEPGAATGQFKLDDKGEVVKEYIKDLEMTVQVK
ncbi:DUF5643 domain-containing protein [Paenibacillus azoreducens]|uniref:DUF5643 domain-containing protein n=1 Tax=Paenibacillus azoreducens TaxID=116718 RepID=A0A920CS51_9BACL|nr:DUF5643 domain-containing protein [Paenibacillus azoreducens]GIO48925.1 hypothetical protein J34TS1_36900 [Paenibacillus azoreducens]